MADSDTAQNPDSAPTSDLHTVDVIVIGGGAAGLAAASMAATCGRSVVLLEKDRELGGSTSWSVGSVSATATPHQFRAGILDNPADHWEDIQKFSAPHSHPDNPELGRILADGSPEMFLWLLSAGIDFVGPMPEPPHRRPRMHNVLPNSRAFAYRLGKLCHKQGVRILTNTRADTLILEQGRATGVRTSGAAGQQTWTARGGIVLAGGDYSASKELKTRFASPEAALADPVNPLATGEGIRLGLEAGGEVLNGDYVRGPFLRFVPPARPALLARLPAWRVVTRLMRWGYEHLPSAILRPVMMKFLTTTLAPDAGLFREGSALVDRDGALIEGARVNPHLGAARAPGGLGYIVMDQRIATQFRQWPHFISTAPGVAYAYLDDYRRTRSDICFTAPTLKDLAKRLGMDPGRFTEAVTRHNAQLAADPKTAKLQLTNAPFYCLGPAKAYVVFTNGGLRVSTRLEVLRPDGAVIPGLYAAGSNGQGGQLLEGHGHHLGWAFVSGREAGRNAAMQSTR